MDTGPKPLLWHQHCCLPLCPQALSDHDYPAQAVAAILGANFLRVAEQVWKAPSTQIA
jgi:microsomal dipeptidase-like Zn-dependent dipeptidase